MEYKDALKLVQTKKQKENFLVIELSYNSKVVLPYKDGMLFMSALTNAEVMLEPYNDQHRISEFDRSAIKTQVLSYDEYERYKIAGLLQIKPEEVKALQAA